MERRQFIATTVLTAAVGLAGCLGGGGESENNDSDGEDTGSSTTDEDASGPKAVMRSYYEAADDKDAAGANKVIHSKSTIDPEKIFGEGSGSNWSYMVENLEVVEEDLGEDAIRERLGSSANIVGEDAIDTFASADNVVLGGDVTVRRNDEVIKESLGYFLAKEEGEWKLVILLFTSGL